MDIYFQYPSDIPLPPEEARFRELRTEPYTDGRHMRTLRMFDALAEADSEGLLVEVREAAVGSLG